MAEFGLTPKGPNIKRLDTIIDEMHSSLTEKLGVNTRQNPQSVFNHIITTVADRFAELWEFGEDVYFSEYPSTAEGTSLDNAAQYGGVPRETAKKSYYPIHCKGTDGTVLAAGTMIASKTNPKTYLTLTNEKILTRSSFNKAGVKVVSATAGEKYTVSINSDAYTYISTRADPSEILNSLAALIKTIGFTVSCSGTILTIEADDITSSNVLVLSENLTTDTVTSVIVFSTLETGDILIPEKAITEITKADAGLLEVTNLCGYVPGNDEESDVEFRKSYADKIFNRSSMMLESIRSALLNNVQGISSVAPYENDTNKTDEYGRPPHSIEIVVDGGDPVEIAKTILSNKAAGISTFGDISVTVPGLYDENIETRFSRPTNVFVWFKLGITLRKNESIPANYAELLKEVVVENIDKLDAGSDVVPQEFMSELYKACSGIGYIDISLYRTEESIASPPNYNSRSAEITARQRAYTTAEMIEVVIDG